jgi:hypothetical protein
VCFASISSSTGVVGASDHDNEVYDSSGCNSLIWCTQGLIPSLCPAHFVSWGDEIGPSPVERSNR